MNKTLIVSDIHGCGYELEKLIEIAQPTRIIAVGDLFDRANKPYLVWQLIHKFGIESCLGNHENKFKQFFLGERESVPKHYEWALNKLNKKGVSTTMLLNYIASLPLQIILDDGSIVTHAAVDPLDPYKQDLSINAYGNLSDCNTSQPLFKDEWWKKYELLSGVPHVYCGHVGREHAILLKNSTHLDTRACFGGKLTGIIHETKTIIAVDAPINYYDSIRKQ